MPKMFEEPFWKRESQEGGERLNMVDDQMMKAKILSEVGNEQYYFLTLELTGYYKQRVKMAFYVKPKCLEGLDEGDEFEIYVRKKESG
jgi:hypothetical protein